MRVLAVLLACLACTGHGRRLLMTKPIPSCQTGLSGRVGAHDPHDSLAPLLHLRGGMSGAGCNSVTQGGATEDFRESNIRRSDTVFGLDDVRGGHVEPPPMIPSRSPAYYDEPPPPPFRTTRSAYYDEDLDSDEDLDDIMGLSADMEPNYGIRRMRPGSAGPVRTSITSFGDREDFRERNTRGAMPRRGYAVRRSIAPLDNTESFLERSTRRAGSGYLRGGYVDDIDAAYGAPRTRLDNTESFLERSTRRAGSGYLRGGYVDDIDAAYGAPRTRLDNTESFLERSTRRAGSGYSRGGYVEEMDAAYGSPRTRRGPAAQVGLGEIEDLRDRNMRRAMTRRGYGYGGQVPRHIEELYMTEDFRNGYDGNPSLTEDFRNGYDLE